MPAIAFLLSLTVAATAYGAEPTVAKDTRLVDAVKAGNSAAAVTLLQKRVDVNAPEADGTTALHWATRNDDVTLVDRLIRAGANAKAINRYGVTPLYLACTNRGGAVVQKLMKAARETGFRRGRDSWGGSLH